MVRKTRAASKVLRLMDQDVSYQSAVRRIVKEGKVSRVKLERDLNKFI